MLVPNRTIVDLEICYAKEEAKYVIDERGQAIKIFLNSNSSIFKDSYGSVIKKDNTSIDMYAYPVTDNPNRKEIEKANLFEDTELLLYTAKLDWELNNINFIDINFIVSYIELRGEHYLIKEKGRAGQHANDYIYITFSLTKK